MNRTFISTVVCLCAVTAVVSAQNASQKSGRTARFKASHATGSRPPASLTQEVRVLQGYAIAPVKLDLKDKDVELVGLGSYLVNGSSGCMDCHTSPPFQAGGDPYRGEPSKVNTEGYLAGGVQYGPFTSRNLTPDPTADMKPAGMDWEEFEHVMRTGEDTGHKHPQMGPLLQVMPWPAYRNMTTRELRAIYEYLRAIPAVTTPGN